MSLSVFAGLTAVGGVLPANLFFDPKPAFIDWFSKRFDGLPVTEVGAGTGRTARLLSTAGVSVDAIDVNRRTEMEFPVALADGTSHGYEPGSVVLLCRPCHGVFVDGVLLQAIDSDVKAIVYVGLPKNTEMDLGRFRTKFRRELPRAGLDGESVYVWERKPSVPLHV